MLKKNKTCYVSAFQSQPLHADPRMETWFPLGNLALGNSPYPSLTPFPHPSSFWSCFPVTFMTKKSLSHFLSGFSCRGYSTPSCTRRKYRMGKAKFNRWVQNPFPAPLAEWAQGILSVWICGLFLTSDQASGIGYKWGHVLMMLLRILHCHKKLFHLFSLGLSLGNKRALVK